MCCPPELTPLPQVKGELAAGKHVVSPAAGRDLGGVGPAREARGLLTSKLHPLLASASTRRQNSLGTTRRGRESMGDHGGCLRTARPADRLELAAGTGREVSFTPSVTSGRTGWISPSSSRATHRQGVFADLATTIPVRRRKEGRAFAAATPLGAHCRVVGSRAHHPRYAETLADRW
jgi:hypothetical protein